MVVVIVGARLPDELRWLRVAAIVCAAWIVGSEWPFSALVYYSWLAASAVVALVAIGRTSRAAFGTVETLALLVWVPLAAYLAVPDTEEVTAIGVAFAVAVAVAWLTGQAPTAGELDAVGVAVVWAILLGGRGRWASYVVIGAVGILVLAPAIAAFGRRVDWGTGAARLLVVINLVCGVVMARFAALGGDRQDNLLRAILVLALALAVSAPLIRSATTEAAA